jgi:hypothetical protein
MESAIGIHNLSNSGERPDENRCQSTALAVMESVLLLMISRSVLDADDLIGALEDVARAIDADCRPDAAGEVYRIAKSIQMAAR